MGQLFSLINIPFSYVIRFFYSLTGNYMLALFGFALVVKIVLFPLGIKQQKNMVKQATLRPKEMAIRAKYAGRTDKVTQQKMQSEVMELYQAEHFNPAAGCLPMIIQLLIVFAIYQIVYGPLTYLCSLSADALNALRDTVPGLVQADAALLDRFSDFIKVAEDGIGKFSGNEIQLVNILKALEPASIVNALETAGSYTSELIGEISAVLGNLPNMMFLGADLSSNPSIWPIDALIAVPILNLVTTWGTTKITRKLSYQSPTTAEQQAGMSMKIMEYGMPLMIFYMAFRLPAALGVYWIFQNILGIGQQFLLYKLFPYPKFSEEEMKAAAKELEKKEPKEKKKSSGSGAPVRSLHHIDDDDYEPAPKPQKGNKSSSRQSKAEKETAESDSEEYDSSEPQSVSGVDRAPLKDDK
ncbi:MAG: YidC/Oxa1 family membrane protein insertase [Clostridia bacterium]|nr:YidC/Oxa1 family membrane protein insertase [Clostridia bacterium]